MHDWSIILITIYCVRVGYTRIPLRSVYILYVCVFFTKYVSFYPSTSSTTSVRAPILQTE